MKCTVCEEHITNPISPERLALQMNVWLTEENPFVKKDVMDVLHYFDAFPKEEQCIITKNPMAICPHCFAKEVREIIPLSSKQSDDFERQFTFHIFPQEIEGL